MINADVSFLLRSEESLNLIDDQIKIDFEIDRLGQFLKLRRISEKVKDIVSQNKKLAYLSWFLLIPPSLMMMLEKSPVPFNPLYATVGVVIFMILIILNSFRMKSI